MAGYPRVGERVGPYLLTSELGHGGMGNVYQATQAGLNRVVALKVLDPRLAADPSFVQRFSNEAGILATLDSPHIIQIFDYGEVDGYLTIATQYVAGGDLSRLIGRSGPLPPATALVIFGQIVEALGAAHARGVVHRDVKPANVLLRADSQEPFAYLCDFGIATTREQGITEAGVVVGSHAFMSPERQSGEPATPHSDIYSAGCVLWAMITSHNLYAGSDMQVAMNHLALPVPQLRGTTPLIVELNNIFELCLAKDPTERPSTPAQLLGLVKRARTLADGVAPLAVATPDSGIFRPVLPPGDGTQPASDSPAASTTRSVAERGRRRRSWLIGAGATALAVLLAGVLLVLNWPSAASSASGTAAASVGPPPTAAAVAFECWNATPVSEVADCPAPSGTSALRYLYPSLDEGWKACEYKAYRKTTDAFNCDLSARGLIRYRYWADAGEAAGHYHEKYLDDPTSELLLDGQVVGTRYTSTGKQDGSYTESLYWFGGHFSLTLEAPTPAARDELLQLVRVRSFTDLLGHPVDRAPAEGVFG